MQVWLAANNKGAQHRTVNHELSTSLVHKFSGEYKNYTMYLNEISTERNIMR